MTAKRKLVTVELVLDVKEDAQPDEYLAFVRSMSAPNPDCFVYSARVTGVRNKPEMRGS